jgi:histidine triad (HIT) family protein
MELSGLTDNYLWSLYARQEIFGIKSHLWLNGATSRLIRLFQLSIESLTYLTDFPIDLEVNLTDCIFCKIIAGEATGEIVYKDEFVVAFRDIHPVAPVHILIVPKEHIASVNDVNQEHEIILGRMFTVAREIAKQKEISTSGYRLIINTGSNAGQVIFHLHMHLIGGQRMRFPMG